MKKRILRLIILSIVLFNQQVFAQETITTDITFICTNEVLKEKKVECEIQIEPNEKIKGLELNYEFGEEFSYLESEINKDFKILESNSKGLALINENGITEKTSIAKISFVVSNKAIINKEYNINLKNILLTNGDKDIQITDKTSNIKILSILDIINNISVGNNKLNLQDGVNNYTVNVNYDITTIELTADLKNNKYHFDEELGPRTISNLKEGDNKVKLKIVNDNNMEFTYTINIVRASKEESDEITENPKTGNNKMVTIIVLILSLSLCSIIYLYKKNKKGEVK